MIIPFSPTGVNVNPAKARELRSRAAMSQRAMLAAVEAETARREHAQVRVRQAVDQYIAEAPIRRLLGII